eukprot:NODE_8248_length_526_cov_6.494759_g7192_i0.p3 GENE.NODE_8248_length_526_cov_6.494759_g7192_i0~~NODE_8248_length_526_cov_6.494759_g7192_i0.p3  ORF type:complete len:50 (-),score=1.10 NODE_8248_length_526_cov_6.494759_g7192_i0:129-278(-)
MTEGSDLAPGQEAGQTPPSFWACPAQNDGGVCHSPALRAGADPSVISDP